MSEVFEIVKTAMYGKQVQSNAINDAAATYIVENFLPYVSKNIYSVQELAENVKSVDVSSLSKEAKVGLLLLIGSENFQIVMTDKEAKLSFSIDNETQKVYYTVKSIAEFKQDEETEDDFMNPPEGYTKEPIKPIEEDPTTGFENSNVAYLHRIIHLMDPYMTKSNPTIEDYCREAQTILPRLKKEGKL